MNPSFSGISRIDPAGYRGHRWSPSGAGADAKWQAELPEYARILTSAAAVPGLILAEVDYFLRADRKAMRRLVAEVFDPATRYEYELPLPSDIARALNSTPSSKDSL